MIGGLLLGGLAGTMLSSGIVAGIEHALHNPHLLGTPADALIAFGSSVLGGLLGMAATK